MTVRPVHPPGLLSRDNLRRVPGTALLLHVFLSLLLQLTWFLLPDTWNGLDKNGLVGYILTIVLMQGLCVLLPAFLVMALYRLPATLTVGRATKGALPAGTLILSLLLGIPAAIMLLSANNSLVYLLARSGVPLPVPILPSTFPATSVSVRLLLSLAAGLLPALSEEIFFRGVIQPSMSASGHPATAVWLTAAAFALFHADPLFIAAPFGAALLLGYLRMRTGRLLPCIAAHLSLNLTLLWITPILPRLSGISPFGTLSSASVLRASLLAFTLSAAVTIPLALLLGRNQRIGSSERPETRRRPPVDWKYGLAMLLLVVTIVVIFLTSTGSS